MVCFGNIPKNSCRNKIFSLENTEFEGEMIAVCKYLKSCHMKERLHLFFLIFWKAEQTNVRNHRQADSCSAKSS